MTLRQIVALGAVCLPACLAVAKPTTPPPIQLPSVELRGEPSEPLAIPAICAFVELKHGPGAVCVADIHDLIDSPDLVASAYAVVEATILVGGPEL